MTPPRRRASRTSVFVAVLAATGLVLAACGDDSDDEDAAATTTVEADVTSPTSPDDATTTASAAASATTAEGSDTTAAGNGAASVDRDEWIQTGAAELNGSDEDFNVCLSESIVDAFGYEQLDSSGATPEEFFATSNFSELGLTIPEENVDPLTAQVADCGDLADYFEEAGQFTAVQADCIREFMENDQVAELFVAGVAEMEPSAELTSIQQEVVDCAAGPTTTS